MSEPSHDSESCGKIAQLGGAVGRYTHAYLGHLRRNWASGGKGKAIAAGEICAILVAFNLVFGSGEPDSATASSANESAIQYEQMDL